MAANVSGEYRIFKYYEGLCSSGDFTKEIAKVLALGVKSKAIKDIDGNVIEQPSVLRSKNWDIVYPAPDDSLNFDLNNLTTSEYNKKILNQVSKISDTVILKTTTTEKEIEGEDYDDLTVDTDTNKTSLTMYLEIYHPTYIANPEQYPLDCERKGIIPKLVTKGMYQDNYRTSTPIEEYIYQDANVCDKEVKDDPTIGAIELHYETCDNYVSKINAVLTNDSLSIPVQNGVATSCVINSADLARIKQNDASLYELILNTLNGGEGIEAKDYNLLDTLTVEIIREDSVYNMTFEGIRKVVTYTIPAGKSYQIDYESIQKVVPEFYLDGIYTPISSESFRVDGRTIYFDKNLIFEADTDGVLVVRYEHEFNGNSDVTDRVTLLNNHYILMRMFDKINDDMDGPMDNVYNASGEITQINCHTSPWSKLAWYRDFEEIMVDTVDADAVVNNVHDGTLFVPLETPGLNSDTKIRYWVNTNNDRFSLVVMGNPSLDYQTDRHLISACYCGRIDSFEHSVNDTAGNFALFTSSSTEPCDTTLETEQMTTDMIDYVLSPKDVEGNTYDKDSFAAFLANCPYSTPCAATQSYYIQLSEKTYFNRKEWAKYVIVNNEGKPVTPYLSVFKRNFIMKDGKSDLMQISIDPQYVNFDETYTLYVDYSSYQEKYVITSGISRDSFGNIVDVAKVKDYGINTSDGVTSISMFHTNSKAYYQKHHMLFATTEEYMSKVMYGKSSYTGEYYADRIKVTHGNDGPRGILSDLLVIDSSSLFTLDELVINKDFEKDPEQYEETFVYFPITAPFSPLSDSPNSRYGLALKKEEIEPQYKDEDKILHIAAEELGTIAANWYPVDSDIFPRDKTSNGCDVYWSIKDDSYWYGDENTPSDYCPVQLAVLNTSEYAGDSDIDTPPLVNSKNFTITKGDTKSDGTNSYVKLSGFTVKDAGEVIYYGILNGPESDLVINQNAQIRTVMYDKAQDNPESFEYNINGVPFKGVIGATLPTTDIKIVDASPDKLLVLYSVKTESTTDSYINSNNESESITKNKYIITSYATKPLTDESSDTNDLLQYPCSLNVLTVGGKGSYCVNGRMVQYINTTVDYESKFELAVVPDTGYTFKSADICHQVQTTDSFGNVKTEDAIVETITPTTTGKYVTNGISVYGQTYSGIIISSVTEDIKIKITFEAGT